MKEENPAKEPAKHKPKSDLLKAMDRIKRRHDRQIKKLYDLDKK